MATSSTTSGNSQALVLAKMQSHLNAVMIAMDLSPLSAFPACFSPNATVYIAVADKTFRGTAELAALGKSISEKFAGSQHIEHNVCLIPVAAASASPFSELLSQRQLAALSNVTTGQFVESPHFNVSYWSASRGGAVISRGRHHDILAADSQGNVALVFREIAHVWTAETGDISAK
jgi:hypothetical protein